MIQFNKEYYYNLIKRFNYNPLNLRKIDFSLGNLSQDELQIKYICHHNADIFAQHSRVGHKTIISTGIGLSGPPHIGTISQILRSIFLQKSGIPVNFVLGDLDAYNGKNIPLAETKILVEKYKNFICKLGFICENGSILRDQFHELEVLRTSYLIGHYMEDSHFINSEEDLIRLYQLNKKVDDSMSYRRKLSLNLMISDFIDLHINHGYIDVLVTLGIDEHKYVRFAKALSERLKNDKNNFPDFDLTISGMYTPLIKGLYGFPKMSKSFPESSITVEDDSSSISDKIKYGDKREKNPEDNVIYQMIKSASFYSSEEIKDIYKICKNGGDKWEDIKDEYSEMLIKIIEKWY